MMRNALRAATAAIFAAMALASCATRQDPGKYTVGGVKYGVTEGSFRGRWWNYYERGRSYLDGGFYEEAMRDFDAALAGRQNDQTWPRTYGMHFMLEYFPNREKGVALYYQKKPEAALPLLERSYGQRHSARAAYFIGETHKQMIATEGGDTAAPTIDASKTASPPVGGLQTEVSGVARDDHFVASVTVNDEPFYFDLAAAEVAFKKTVKLQPGQNEVRIRAVDLMGNTTESRVQIETDVDGPAISFDEPVTLPGDLRGVLYDRAGVKSLEIAGVQATLTPAADGAMAFHAALPHVALNAPVTYAANDALGNTTAGNVPVQVAILKSDLGNVVPASAQWESLGSGLHGLRLAGELIIVAADTPPAGPSIEMTNISDNDQFFTDEIVVAMNVRSDQSLKDVSLNGTGVALIPGRSSTTVSRKLPLDKAQKDHEVVATVQDSAGKSAEARRHIRRELTTIEEQENKLGVVFLSKTTAGTVPDKANELMEAVLEDLSGNKMVKERFRVLDRKLLREILHEQDINQYLGDENNRLQLKKIMPAEVFFEIHTRGDEGSVEIVASAISTETSRQFFSFVDAAGAKPDLASIVDKLSVYLVQEFPRINASVTRWSNPRIAFELGAGDRIQDSMKCVVYMRELLGTPKPGQPPQYFTTKVCDGILLGVGPTFSTANVLPAEPGKSIDYDIKTGTDGHWVVIK